MRKVIGGISLTLLVGLVACTKTPRTSYPFVPPVLNSTRIYVETVVDNSQNTAYFDYKVTVTAAADNGFDFTEQQQAISGPDANINGTNYLPDTETQTLNSFGRETGFTYIQPNGTPGSCTFAPYAGGPEPPLTVGETWEIQYTESCNDKPPIGYSQQGSVVDVEQITEPTGEFTALKLQSATSWTDATGTKHVQKTTSWLDVATYHAVRQSTTYKVGGRPPANGYAVSRLIELQSSDISAAAHESPQTQ